MVLPWPQSLASNFLSKFSLKMSRPLFFFRHGASMYHLKIGMEIFFERYTLLVTWRKCLNIRFLDVADSRVGATDFESRRCQSRDAGTRYCCSRRIFWGHCTDRRRIERPLPITAYVWVPAVHTKSKISGSFTFLTCPYNLSQCTEAFMWLKNILVRRALFSASAMRSRHARMYDM